MNSDHRIMFLILIAAVLIEVLTFSFLIFGNPPGAEPEAVLYINSVLAMFIVVVSSVWLLIELLDKRGVFPQKDRKDSIDAIE